MLSVLPALQAIPPAAPRPGSEKQPCPRPAAPLGAGACGAGSGAGWQLLGGAQEASEQLPSSPDENSTDCRGDSHLGAGRTALLAVPLRLVPTCAGSGADNGEVGLQVRPGGCGCCRCIQGCPFVTTTAAAEAAAAGDGELLPCGCHCCSPSRADSARRPASICCSRALRSMAGLAAAGTLFSFPLVKRLPPLLLLLPLTCLARGAASGCGWRGGAFCCCFCCCAFWLPA